LLIVLLHTELSLVIRLHEVGQTTDASCVEHLLLRLLRWRELTHHVFLLLEFVVESLEVARWALVAVLLDPTDGSG